MELYPAADRPRTHDAEHAGVAEGDRRWKALTLWQPWATLVAEGFKCVETRSWSTSYRGPLAIAAGKRKPDVRERIGPFGVGWHRLVYPDHVDEGYTLARTDGQADEHGVTVNPTWPLPLGCVVATCTLVDVAPIGGPYDFRTGIVEGDEGDFPGQAVVVHHPALGNFTESLVIDDGKVTDISGQLPYGDFSPGRYAWLLANIEKVDPPIPAKGRQGLWTYEQVGR